MRHCKECMQHVLGLIIMNRFVSFREERRIIIENKAVKIRERKVITDSNIAEHMKWVAKDQLRKRYATYSSRIQPGFV